MRAESPPVSIPSEDEVKAPPQLARTSREKGKVAAKTSKVRNVCVRDLEILALLLSV